MKSTANPLSPRRTSFHPPPPFHRNSTPAAFAAPSSAAPSSVNGPVPPPPRPPAPAPPPAAAAAPPPRPPAVGMHDATTRWGTGEVPPMMLSNWILCTGCESVVLAGLYMLALIAVLLVAVLAQLSGMGLLQSVTPTAREYDHWIASSVPSITSHSFVRNLSATIDETSTETTPTETALLTTNPFCRHGCFEHFDRPTRRRRCEPIEWRTQSETRLAEAGFPFFPPAWTVCTEDSLSGVVMMMNVSRWNNFRGALLLLAVLFLCVVIPFFYLLQGFAPSWPMDSPYQGYQDPQYPPPPFLFASRRFHIMRLVWAGVAWVVAVWSVVELAHFHRFMDGVYRPHMLAEDAQDRLSDYRSKHLGGVWTCLVLLYWPLIELALSIVLTFVTLPFWLYGRCSGKPPLWWQRDEIIVRAKQRLYDERHPSSAPTRPKVTTTSEVPWSTKIEHFVYEFRALRRWGFSEEQWTVLTGSDTPFFSASAPGCRCCSQPDDLNEEEKNIKMEKLKLQTAFHPRPTEANRKWAFVARDDDETSSTTTATTTTTDSSSSSRSSNEIYFSSSTSDDEGAAARAFASSSSSSESSSSSTTTTTIPSDEPLPPMTRQEEIIFYRRVTFDPGVAEPVSGRPTRRRKKKKKEPKKSDTPVDDQPPTDKEDPKKSPRKKRKKKKRPPPTVAVQQDATDMSDGEGTPSNDAGPTGDDRRLSIASEENAINDGALAIAEEEVIHKVQIVVQPPPAPSSKKTKKKKKKKQTSGEEATNLETASSEQPVLGKKQKKKKKKKKTTVNDITPSGRVPEEIEH